MKQEHRSEKYYPMLDALRGFASFSVVLYHLSHWLNAPWLATNSNLAVDMFYCLSGFVLASAYSERKDMSFAQFAVRRFISASMRRENCRRVKDRCATVRRGAAAPARNGYVVHASMDATLVVRATPSTTR